MRKAILVLIASAFVLTAYAQDADFDSFKRIESDKMLNLSADQIAKIKEMNREVKLKFRAIGQSNLPGYEKGKKKKALALEHKAAIRKLLTESQIKEWENHYGSMSSNKGLRNIVKDNYEVRLNRLEKQYEKDKDAIENSSLPKEQRKAKLKALKNKYKTEKENLKYERDMSAKSGVLDR